VCLGDAAGPVELGHALADPLGGDGRLQVGGEQATPLDQRSDARVVGGDDDNARVGRVVVTQWRLHLSLGGGDGFGDQVELVERVLGRLLEGRHAGGPQGGQLLDATLDGA
jgi:hypothetical protein